MKNCYEMALRLFEVSEAVKVLGDKMSKSNNPNDIKIFSHQMDVLDKEFLIIKHSLEEITYKEKVV